MPPPPRLPNDRERLASAQIDWNAYRQLRALRLRYKAEKIKNQYGYKVREESYARKEAKVEENLLSLNKKLIEKYIESGNNSALWFKGKNMLGDNSPMETIGLLGLLATADVGDRFIERCFIDNLQDSAWLHRNQFEGHEADYPPWTTKEDDASLKLQQFCTMVDALAKDPDSPPLWKHLNAMFRLNGYLMKILRFIDEQNAHLGGLPALPDGSNIEEAPLRASWVLHRAWIRLLHYRSLSFGSKPHGINQLAEILIVARAQLEQEIRQAPADSRKILEGLIEFETALESLTLFLQTLATEFGQDSVPKPGARRPYSVSDFDIDTDRVGASWTQITQPRRSDPLGNVVNPLGHMLLWSQLLDRAADFEDRNNRYYVEDHLFENRVLAEDEHFEMTNLMHRSHYFPDNVKNRGDSAQQKYVRALAKKVSQVNINRRNFLLLRDWSKKRPWKQLYWVFDTVTTESWREQIDNFYNTIEGLKVVLKAPSGEENAATDTKKRTEFDPESEPNLFANVFPIHPIPSHDPQKYAGPYFGNCVYCLEDYKPGELWLRYFCDHLVHYDCGRDSWDNPGNPDFRCPLCRHIQSWQLHEVAGIVPETIDLWDNVDLVGNAEAAYHPIVQLEGTPGDVEGFKELYWEAEAANLDASENWDLQYPRLLHHEMAQMRNARRKRVLRARHERIEREKEYPQLAE